jgi:hypothetical protein
VCDVASASTLTLTTGSANFTLIGGSGVGSGTVTTISVVTANGVSATVANATTTPALTFTLGDITPTHINSVALSGSSTPTLAVTGTSSISGANTGDQTITLSGDVSTSGMTNGTFTSTIGAGAVTLAKMANLAANSIIGNNTGSPATPVAMTVAQTRTLLQTSQSQENFEAAHDSASHYIATLAHTPQGIGAVTVILNGMPLTNVTDYALVETLKIRITRPVMTYDKISIAYQY